MKIELSFEFSFFLEIKINANLFFLKKIHNKKNDSEKISESDQTETNYL